MIGVEYTVYCDGDLYKTDRAACRLLLTRGCAFSSDAWNAAVVDGWVARAGHHLCPSCAAEIDCKDLAWRLRGDGWLAVRHDALCQDELCPVERRFTRKQAVAILGYRDSVAARLSEDAIRALRDNMLPATEGYDLGLIDDSGWTDLGHEIARFVQSMKRRVRVAASLFRERAGLDVTAEEAEHVKTLLHEMGEALGEALSETNGAALARLRTKLGLDESEEMTESDRRMLDEIKANVLGSPRPLRSMPCIDELGPAEGLDPEGKDNED